MTGSAAGPSGAAPATVGLVVTHGERVFFQQLDMGAAGPATVPPPIAQQQLPTCPGGWPQLVTGMSADGMQRVVAGVCGEQIRLLRLAGGQAPWGQTIRLLDSPDERQQPSIGQVLVSGSGVVVAGAYRWQRHSPGGRAVDRGVGAFVVGRSWAGPMAGFVELYPGDVFLGAALAFRSDQVVVAGWFRGAAQIGSHSVVSRGGTGGLVAALSLLDATPLWVAHLGGIGDARATGLALDPLGGLVVTGVFSGELMLRNQTLTSHGQPAVFEVKLGELP